MDHYLASGLALFLSHQQCCNRHPWTMSPCMHLHQFLENRYQEVGFLGHRVWLTPLGFLKLPCKLSVLIYNSATSVWVSIFLWHSHQRLVLLDFFSSFLFHTMGMTLCLAVLKFSFPWFTVYFHIGQLIFFSCELLRSVEIFILVYETSLFRLATNPSVLCIANILSQSMACLLFLVSLTSRNFYKF